MAFVLISVIKAVIARLILIIHALLAVWRVAVVNDGFYWLLLLGFVGILVDTAIVLVKRHGAEWKWFSPTVFFYLCTACPSIWFLELHRLDEKRQGREQRTPRPTQSTGAINHFVQATIPLNLEDEEWILFIEQAMLLILIITRWLMPKGEMSHDQLSQLLLVYLGLAADVVELFAIFDEPGILDSLPFIFCILAAWSWSLMQFTLVLTATRDRAFKVNPETMENSAYKGCFCCESEVWSILIMIFMLDLPFLALRLVAVAYFKVSTYTIYFFTCKNILVLILQFYRLTVVCVSHHKEESESDEEQNASNKSQSEETNLSLSVSSISRNDGRIGQSPAREYGSMALPPSSPQRQSLHLRR
ncbi:transmembrane protein 26-like [Tubulanus polymorphus]|uniref:transmembrane protein 26-like n=1 Tax=Tubulanus polymorphus TaxID=672921 RepID=UPI003DA40A48